MSAFPQSLNFANLPRKSMGSRVAKVNVAPANGATFAPGGNINIQLPTMAASYCCLDQSYLKFKIKAKTQAANLDHSAYSLFSRIDTTSQSQVISSLGEANVYYSWLLDTGMGAASARDWGATCLGMGGDPDQTHIGAELSTTATKTVCLPFMHGIFNARKLMPLDTAAGVTFTFYLADAAAALISSVNAAQTTGYEITDVEFCTYVTTLSPDAQALLDSSVPDLGYNIAFEDVANTTAHKEAAQLKVVSNLGFRYSALSRVSVIHRVSTNANSFKQLSVSNRSHANMSELALSVGGLSVPQVPIRMAPGDKAEALTETLIAWGVLGSQDHQLGLNGVTRVAAGTSGAVVERYDREDGKFPDNKDGAYAKTYAAEIGTFGVSIDTDIIKSGENDAGSAGGGIYSGISTLGSTCQSMMSYSAASTSDQAISYFANYTAILSLDPISRAFTVSV